MISFKVTVFAREGRGGGDVLVAIVVDIRVFTTWEGGLSLALAAKGSCSITRGEGLASKKLFLLTPGLGF